MAKEDIVPLKGKAKAKYQLEYMREYRKPMGKVRTALRHVVRPGKIFEEQAKLEAPMVGEPSITLSHSPNPHIVVYPEASIRFT